jgi:hypothetical protein
LLGYVGGRCISSGLNRLTCSFLSTTPSPNFNISILTSTSELFCQTPIMTKRILDCSDELLLKIFAYLATKRPAGHCKHCNYYQLSRTCSRFHQVALPLLYHGIQFMTKDGLQRSKGYPVPSLELLIRVINTHPERAGWIHYAKFGWLEQSIATWHAIFDVCARLLALRTLSLRVYWDIPWSLREGLRICEKVTFAKLGRLPTLSCTSINVEDPRITTEDVASFCALPKLEHFKVIRLCKETTTTAIPAADIDSCVTPVRRLEFFKCTDMPKEQTLQGFFKKHSSLRELTWKVEHMDSPGWDPSDTLTNLLPLCSTLVKLRLSIGKGCGCNAYTGVGRIMDFTQFTALKVLEVHGLILFPRQFRIRRFSTEWAAPYNFPEKLPESLEELQVSLSAFQTLPVDVYFLILAMGTNLPDYS